MKATISLYFILLSLSSVSTYANAIKCDYSVKNSCPKSMYCVFVDKKEQAYCRESYKKELPIIAFPFKKPVTCYKAVDHDHKQSSHSWLNARYAIDLHSDENTTQNIYAGASGFVVAKGGCLPADPKCNGWFGNQVKILAPNGILVFYAHLSRLFVKTGDYVNVGDLIGREGDTGAVGGMWSKPHDFHHLHMSVHSDWTRFNDDYHSMPYPGSEMPSIPFKLKICDPKKQSKCEIVDTHINNLSCSKFVTNPGLIRGL